MADIFFSYKKTDHATVLPIVRLLEAQGWTVWWDERLNVGEAWDAEIERELAAASCVVVGWSANSTQSTWVRNEAREGLRRNILAPLSIDGSAPPLEFNHVQAANFLGWEGDPKSRAVATLIAAVKQKAGAPKNPSTEEMRDPANFERLARLKAEEQHWREIEAAATIEDLDHFLAAHGDGGIYRGLATARLTKLRREAAQREEARKKAIADEQTRARAAAEIEQRHNLPEVERKALLTPAVIRELKNAIIEGRTPDPLQAALVRYITITNVEANANTAREIGIFDEAFFDTQRLRSFTGLNDLSLYGTKVSDLSPLSALKRLQAIDCGGTQVSDCRPLVQLPSLARLVISTSAVTDLSPLFALRNLVALDIGNTKIADWAQLASLPKTLTSLNAHVSSLSDLSPIAQLSLLKSLLVSNTAISNLSPLARLPNLQSLWLQNSQVRDLAPLAGLSKLEFLGVSSTRVTDLAPLRGHPSLQFIDVRGSKITDLSVLATMPKLTSCRTDFQDGGPYDPNAKTRLRPAGAAPAQASTPLTPRPAAAAAAPSAEAPKSLWKKFFS